jgi:hypothetical protein
MIKRLKKTFNFITPEKIGRARLSLSCAAPAPRARTPLNLTYKSLRGNEP